MGGISSTGHVCIAALQHIMLTDPVCDLQARAQQPSQRRSGGVLLAMIEGLGILLTRATAPPPAPPLMEMAPGGAPLPQPGHPPSAAASAPACQRPFLGGIVSFCVGANAC